MARTMRRFKQQLSAEETEKILRNGKYCVMAVSGDNDYPYALPINYIYDGTSIFIHSAAQGHKRLFKNIGSFRHLCWQQEECRRHGVKTQKRRIHNPEPTAHHRRWLL